MASTQSENAIAWLASRCDAFTARLDRSFTRVERSVGVWGACLVFGVLLLLTAAIYTAPATHLINHGNFYGHSAIDPFAEGAASPIRLRPLSPFIAHYLFLRGEAFMAFPLLAAVLFLAVVMRMARQRGFSGSESIAAGSLLAFTSPILFTLHFAGYVDTVSYLFIALALYGVGSDLIIAACVCLAFLNHDSNVFVFPWLLFHAARHRSTWLRRARLGAAVAGGLVVAFLVRRAISSGAPVTWEPQFYLNLPYLRENALLNVRGAWLGIFMAFKLCWLLPLFAALDLAVKKRRAALVDLAFAALSGLATMIITSDSSRLPSLSFAAILGGAAVLRKDILTPPRFGRWVWALVFVNLLVPQYYVGQSKPIVFYPLPIALTLKAAGYNPWDDWLGLKQMHFSQE